MERQAYITLAACFITAFIARPAIERYSAWKNGDRVRYAVRNWRGVYVEDLNVKRAERGAATAACLFLCAGISVLAIIFMAAS